MAILATTDPGISGALKNYYSRFREDLFPLITPTFAQFSKFKSGGPRNMRWGGNGVIFDVVTGDPTGWVFSQNGNLPESNFRTEVQANVPIRRMYVRQQIDYLTVPATDQSAKSFIGIAQKIDEELRLKYRLGVQEAIHGDGRGVKAIVTNINTAGISFDVTQPYGITAASNGGVSAGQGALWLAVGQLIVARDSTGATKRGTFATIQTIALKTAPDTYTVTVDTALTGVAPGDLIVGGTKNDDQYNGSTNGLSNMLNRGAAYTTGATALHGVDAAVYKRWDTTRMTAGVDTPRVDSFLEGDFYELAMRVAGKSGFNAITSPDEFIIVTTPGVKKSHIESLVGQRTLNAANIKQLNGGYGYDVQINGVPVIDDPYCPAGTVMLLHVPSLGWIDAKDFGAVEYETAGAWRFVADRDAYETSMSIFWNLCTTFRGSHGMIVGFTDNSRYSPVAY